MSASSCHALIHNTQSRPLQQPFVCFFLSPSPYFLFPSLPYHSSSGLYLGFFNLHLKTRFSVRQTESKSQMSCLTYDPNQSFKANQITSKIKMIQRSLYHCTTSSGPKRERSYPSTRLGVHDNRREPEFRSRDANHCLPDGNQGWVVDRP